MEHRSLQILRRSYTCGLSSKAQRLMLLLQDLEDLTPGQKTRIINRYVEITEGLHTRTLIYAWIFHGGRLIVTVGSLIVPALLSIQYTDTTASATTSPQSFSYNIYWATWVVSLLVTVCNGILSLFKIDKKYYFLHTTYEQFQSELWQYIHLTGKYAGHYTKGKPITHETQYMYFCHVLEKIKLKQVEEEYYKMSENTNATASHPRMDLSGNTAGTKDPKVIAGIYAPTPDQETLIQHQQRLAESITNPYSSSYTSQTTTLSPSASTSVSPSRPTIENSIVLIDGPPSSVEDETTDEGRENGTSTKNTVSV